MPTERAMKAARKIAYETSWRLGFRLDDNEEVARDLAPYISEGASLPALEAVAKAAKDVVFLARRRNGRRPSEPQRRPRKAGGETMKDGGPAFPESHPACPSPASGLTKREWFAGMAPAQEIAEMCPADGPGCARLLGIATNDFRGEYYAAVLAKLRYQWADAMIDESSREMSSPPSSSPALSGAASRPPERRA